jgi:hypothetical protein
MLKKNAKSLSECDLYVDRLKEKAKDKSVPSGQVTCVEPMISCGSAER